MQRWATIGRRCVASSLNFSGSVEWTYWRKMEVPALDAENGLWIMLNRSDKGMS